jgi:hypothetical protein
MSPLMSKGVYLQRLPHQLEVAHAQEGGLDVYQSTG